MLTYAAEQRKSLQFVRFSSKELSIKKDWTSYNNAYNNHDHKYLNINKLVANVGKLMLYIEHFHRLFKYDVIHIGER